MLTVRWGVRTTDIASAGIALPELQCKGSTQLLKAPDKLGERLAPTLTISALPNTHAAVLRDVRSPSSSTALAWSADFHLASALFLKVFLF
jgi:hypothetical protein